MKFILKVLIGILNLIFALFKLLPVRDKVTFISRQSDDKTEDMSLLEKQLRAKEPGLKIVFLCRKLEGNLWHKAAYCLHIFRQMYHIATSRVVILDSYCIAVSVLKQRESLTVIQMWHALGSLKKFGLSIIGSGEGRSEGLADVMAMHRNYTFVLTSGEACVEHFCEAFGYDRSHMKVMSLPRVDKLTQPDLKEASLKKIYEEYPEFKDKKVIVYAPTFRKERDISGEIDALAEKFDTSEYIFVLKKHPLMDVRCKAALVDEKFTTLEMLFAADYVVCDYSAVIFEAAIIGKPMFFYTFDYESYGVNRDFYIDYMKEMPGFISGDANELYKAIREDRYDLEKIKAFAGRYVTRQENCSAELADMILESCKRSR